MRKTRSKIRAIDVELLLSWEIHIVASWAINLDSGRRQFLRHADREDMLSLAEHTWARSKRTLHELLPHLRESVGRQDEPGVNDAVEVHGRLVDLEEVWVV